MALKQQTTTLPQSHNSESMPAKNAVLKSISSVPSSLTASQCSNDNVSFSSMLSVQSTTSAMISIPSSTRPLECLETSSLVPAVSQMITESIYQPMHSSTTCESSSWVTIEKHWLSIEDKQIITENKWLNDRIIHVTHLLIKRHCPDINGFQSSLLGKLYNFKKASSPFIQILNVKKNHNG